MLMVNGSRKNVTKHYAALLVGQDQSIHLLFWGVGGGKAIDMGESQKVGAVIFLQLVWEMGI